MANTATLADLRTRALDYADMTSSAYPVEGRVTDYVNSGLAELHDILVNSYEDYYRKTFNITLSSSQEEYAVPDDFYKLLQIYYLSSGRRFKLEKFGLHGLDGYRATPISGGGQLEMWYVPQFDPLTQDSDTVDFRIVPGWEDYVALHAASRLLIREESDDSQLKRELAEIRGRIKDMAEPRDIATPDQIQDYYGRWNNAQHVFRFEERYLRYRLMAGKIHIIEFEYLGL